MVDTIASAQTLNEFVQNLLDDLVGGRITPEAAIIASSQYPRLRRVIGDHNDEIAGALQDEGGLRIVLEGVLRVEALAINRELPQFQVEKPDSRLLPEDVVARARSLRAARLEVVAAMGAQRAQVERTRKTFIGRLVQNWIARTASFIDKEDQQHLAGGLQTELDQKLSGDLSADEAAGRVRRALTNARVGEAAAATIQQEAAPSQQELAVAKQRLAGIDAIPKELVVRLDSPRPDRFATIAIQTISTTTLSPSAALARAASLAKIVEAMSISLPKEKDVAAAGVFFRAFASGPTQKAFAAAADAIFTQLSPVARQEVIKAVFSRALEGLLAKTDVLVGRLGQDFVESELFRVAVGGARKEFARGAGGVGAGVKQARGALEDIIVSIFGGPIMGPIVGGPRETVLSYLELLATEARLPRDKTLLFPDRPAAAGAGAASLAALVQRLPSWQMFYLMLLSSSFSRLGQRALISLGGVGQDIVKAPGAAGLGFLSFFGSVGLRAISGVGRVGLSFIEGIGGGLIGMMFGGGLGGVLNRLRGPRAPDRFLDDMPKFMAVFIVVVIVLLFVFPSFLNTKLTSGAARLAALLVNAQVYNTGGPYDPVEDMVVVASDLLQFVRTGDLSCPVGRQPISQRPFDARGSHKRVCAYDFAAPKGTVVTTTHYGCITAMERGVPVDLFKDKSYGNFVKLIGKAPDGKTFYTIYGHMYDMSPGLALGGCYAAGTPIGRVDATGYTYRSDGTRGGGTHLHYEYVAGGGGCIALPAACK